MEFRLLAAAALGIGAAFVGLWWDQRRAGGAGPVRQSGDVLLTAAVAGLLVGRLAAMQAGGTNPITHPADVLIIRSGVHTGAASGTALAVAAFMSRRDLLPSLDRLAAGSLAGLAGWHAGCLIRGTCLGTPTGLPWGISQTGSEIARHPVEVYAALALLAGAGLLLLWRRRAPGIAAGTALGWASAVRLLTEPMRPGIGVGPEGWYVAGIVVGAALVTWAVLDSRRSGGNRQP